MIRNPLPLVSVITPSLNQGHFIAETIESVLSQEYSNIEYIVIDGGSSDSTIEILKKYGNQLSWVSEPDAGQSDAINKGFRKAKGEILCWLNADDTYLPGAIGKAVEYMMAHPDVMMTYGGSLEIDQHSKAVRPLPAATEFDLSALVYVCDYIVQPTTFMRRGIFEAIDMLDINLHWCMDWDLWVRIGSRFKIAYVDYVFARSRVYAETKTTMGGVERFKEITALMRKHGGKKYPIGFFIYGVDTIEALVKQRYPIFFLFSRTILFLPIRIVLIAFARIFFRLPI